MWATREQSGTGYVHVRLPGHPLANSRGTVRQHRVVLWEQIGPGTHPCHWCQTPVTWRTNGDSGTHTAAGALLTDHLDGARRNNAPENLVPSCHTCNVWRNPPREPVRDDELFITRPDGSRSRAISKPCEYCSTPFLRLVTINDPRSGRFCSRTCARRAQFLRR